MTTPTGKSIAAYWARATAGTRMTCIDNSNIPAHVGRSGIVSKPGASSIRITMDDGRDFWISPPRNVRDTVSIDGDTITYRIGGTHRTATWRIDGPDDPIVAEPAPSPRVAMTTSGQAYLLPGIDPAPVRRGNAVQLAAF